MNNLLIFLRIQKKQILFLIAFFLGFLSILPSSAYSNDKFGVYKDGRQIENFRVTSSEEEKNEQVLKGTETSEGDYEDLTEPIEEGEYFYREKKFAYSVRAVKKKLNKIERMISEGDDFSLSFFNKEAVFDLDFIVFRSSIQYLNS